MRVLKLIGLTFVIFFGVLFMIAFLVGFIQGVSDSINENDKVGVSKVETPKSNTVPAPKEDTKVSLKSDKYTEVLPSARATFVEGCTSEGSTNATCTCMYDWLDNDLTNVEFGKLIAEANEGGIPDKAWEAVRACVSN